MAFVAEMTALVERASVVAVQRSMLACDELSTIIFVHGVRADGAIGFVLCINVYPSPAVLVAPPVPVRRHTHFDCTAAPGDNFVIPVLVEQPCGA